MLLALKTVVPTRLQRLKKGRSEHITQSIYIPLHDAYQIQYTPSGKTPLFPEAQITDGHEPHNPMHDPWPPCPYAVPNAARCSDAASLLRHVRQIQEYRRLHRLANHKHFRVAGG